MRTMNTIAIGCLVLGLCFSVIHGCCNPEGSWINTKGSKMYLKHNDGLLIGEFDVDKMLNGTNDPVNNFTVRGVYTKEGLISWSIVFENSVAAFAGQHFEKNNEEEIRITWILTTEANSIEEHWMNNRLGQDVFKRIGPKPTTKASTDWVDVAADLD